MPDNTFFFSRGSLSDYYQNVCRRVSSEHEILCLTEGLKKKQQFNYALQLLLNQKKPQKILPGNKTNTSHLSITRKSGDNGKQIFQFLVRIFSCIKIEAINVSSIFALSSWLYILPQQLLLQKGSVAASEGPLSPGSC